MPIKAKNRSLYPKDWAVISYRIRFIRGEGRCECTGECGIDHASEQLKWPRAQLSPLDRCCAQHGEAHPVTYSAVVLTTAHLDHSPENCADDNLKGMCQRCHLRYDAAHHKKNSEATRRERKASGDLFDNLNEESPKC